MILYDIIRYHNPPILPQGGVLGGTIFLNFIYQDFDVRSGTIHFIQKKVFGPSKNLKIKMVRERRKFFCYFSAPSVISFFHGWFF
jgi:hypothetical protein